MELPLIYQKVPRAERKERVEKALARVDLQRRAKHLPTELSGGQQQRVAIARAIVTRPSLLLADEPTASLDEANAGQVSLLLSGYARTLGSTLLVVSHDDAVLADMDRVLDLNRGIVREAA